MKLVLKLLPYSRVSEEENGCFDSREKVTGGILREKQGSAEGKKRKEKKGGENGNQCKLLTFLFFSLFFLKDQFSLILEE